MLGQGHHSSLEMLLARCSAFSQWSPHHWPNHLRMLLVHYLSLGSVWIIKVPDKWDPDNRGCTISSRPSHLLFLFFSCLATWRVCLTFALSKMLFQLFSPLQILWDFRPKAFFSAITMLLVWMRENTSFISKLPHTQTPGVHCNTFTLTMIFAWTMCTKILSVLGFVLRQTQHLAVLVQSSKPL